VSVERNLVFCPRNTLLIPELAHENETVAVFSDYGGESEETRSFT
jgi:hypothetical protein